MTVLTARGSCREPSRRRVPVAYLSPAPLLVHGLVHRARCIRVRVYPDVDERRKPRLARPAQGRTDLAGIAHLLSMSAEHLGELVVGHVAQRVADPAASLPVLLDLAVANLVHRGVVANDADKRQVEAHHRLEVPAREAEGTVAEEDHDLLVGA